MDDLKLNGSGIKDPTAHKAIKNVSESSKTDKQEFKLDPERVRFEQFLHLVFRLSEICGYHIEGRMVVKDRKTGKVWR